MDLTGFDIIIINTSAGKDSLAMLDYVAGLAKEQGIEGRVVAAHCDLGRMEWAGTKELAYQQCLRYQIPMHVVERPQGDLLKHVEGRGMWPGPSTRYCTSDHKTLQVEKLMTKLVKEFNAEHQAGVRPRQRRRVRILNCLGLRAAESPKRAGMEPISVDPATNPTVRDVTRWLPIHGWSDAQVWDLIHSKSLPYHKAYDLGMPRLSCVFCFYAQSGAAQGVRRGRAEDRPRLQAQGTAHPDPAVTAGGLGADREGRCRELVAVRVSRISLLGCIQLLVVVILLDMNAMMDQDARREQMLRDLSSSLAALVESGDLTDVEANEWFNMKADQWAQGLS